MRLRIPVVVGSVILAAIASVIAAYGISPHQPPELLKLALGLAGFAVVAELLAYRMPQGGQGSIALIPFLAIALVAPTWQGALAVGAAEIVVQLIRKISPLKAAFNTAQAVLSIASGSIVFVLAGGSSVTQSEAFRTTVVENALPAVLCLACVTLSNSVAVSAVISASSGQSFVSVWKQNTLGTAAYALIAWPFACGLAWVYAHQGPVFAVAIAIPMLGVRQLYMTSLKLHETNRELLELMVKAIEARDPYTSGHSRRVASSAVVIARSLSLNARVVERIRIAALLHDIGKIHEDFAPILRKDGPLTKEEWAIMKTHSDKGAELISTLSDLRDLVAPVRHHHENWDGTGYPTGIAGAQIPLTSRIITFADTIDALTTDRPYRPARTTEQVRAELVRCRGTQFDPDICDVVLSQAVWSQLFAAPSSDETRKPTPQRVKLVKLG
jgi:putative nucleotidyltransferase with HDIG domain